MRTIKLTIEYDGSVYAGWQIQPNERTIQGEIEKALQTLTQEEIRTVGAGRTDAGVHALGQVASFRCRNTRSLHVFQSGLNALMPRDIRILDTEEAKPDFNARKDAVSRTYRYRLLMRNRAIGRQYAWYPRIPFSVGEMRKASELLKGNHVWKSFCHMEEERGSMMSKVLDVSWNEIGDEVQFEIKAERFFHNMVRIIIGTLLKVGSGKISVEQFKQVLDSEDRTQAGQTVPPIGLFLVRVDY
jgi:tRNA pseudouridine38-40 synthase